MKDDMTTFLGGYLAYKDRGTSYSSGGTLSSYDTAGKIAYGVTLIGIILFFTFISLIAFAVML